MAEELCFYLLFLLFKRFRRQQSPDRYFLVVERNRLIFDDEFRSNDALVA